MATPEQKWPPQLSRLLASIDTVDRLDVLIHLHALRGKEVTSRAVAASCSLSTMAADHHLAALCGRGFLAVNIGTELSYAYRPVHPATRALLDELVDLNAARRADIVAALRVHRRALIAEDDPDMREILRAFLENRGWRSTALPHGRDAMSCAATADLGVAIVDVRATHTHGLTVVRALRERAHPVPTIVTTSFGDARLQARLADVGVTAVLEKPFDLDEFARTLDRCG